MNILLFTAQDVVSQTQQQVELKITGERFQHLAKVQKFSVGDQLRIGELNGLRGVATLTSLDKDSITLIGHLDQEPPTPAQAKLILAMPRPIMLKRILVDIAMLGIKEIVLLQSTHVQKSYWTSKVVFENDGIDELLLRGLEQSCDTVMPQVTIEKRFKPFVEDKLKTFCQFDDEASDIILAHPNSEQICPQPAQRAFTLIVGPENGFTPYEVELLTANGATAYTLGERHLRVETAATYLLGRLL